MQAVAAAVLDCRRENVEPAGGLAVEVIKYGTAAKIVANAVADILAHGLEEGMAWRDPFRRRILRQQRLVEDNLTEFAAEFAEPGLQPVADGMQACAESDLDGRRETSVWFPWDGCRPAVLPGRRSPR